MLAKIIACQPAEPGTAQLMVRLRGETAILTNLTFTLCNNEQNFLQPDGSWSPAQHWFTMNGGYALNNGSGFRIGPTLLDPLLATASQVQIQIKLDSGETRNTTLQLVRDELLSSEARGETGNYSGSSMLSTPEVPSEPVIATETVVAPEPVEPVIHTEARTPAKSGSSRLPVIGAAILALVVIAGALWWFLGRDKSPEVPPVEQTQQETPASAPAAAPEPVAHSTCSAQGLNSQNELDFVQSCVQEKLDSDKLLTIIQAAKEAKKCGVAQRLYANRAQGGDTKIALVYAGEYDPKYHQPSECFKAPDKDTAAYWYETVLQTEPDNQTAKQRLEELGK
ncbi:hypothetical protein [Citrobacter farmeri]|uniref:hypothetical protein n=1 Tax=Citrobacter farmeri TaxID=67824 RepID=UPI002A8264D4|nr:hypothetical protein [Citrobacter farmeri]